MRKFLIIFVFVSFYLSIQSVTDAAGTFRFALFTDLHISAANPLPAEDLQNAVNDVNSIKGIDFVLVTGDITQSGDTTSLKIAKHLLESLKMPFYIVPGNHDFHWNTGNGAADFIRIFGDDKFAFKHKKIFFAGFTTVPLDQTGNGYMQENDIEWLKKTLKKAGKSKPSIIATHYPLLKGDVDNRKEIIDLLKKYNVIAVLSGHYHRNLFFNYNDIPGVVNRSVLRGNESVGGYSLYTVSDSVTVSEKRIGEEEHVWLTFPVNLKHSTNK